MVYGAALEKRSPIILERGFESHPLRHRRIKMARKYQSLPKLDDWIARFFKALKDEPNFLKDTKWHNEAVQNIKQKVFRRIDDLKPEEFKKLIEDGRERAMMRPRPKNRKDILAVIDSDFDRVKRYLTFIKDFAGDPQDIDKLLDSSGTLYIKGAGLFFITQLLAGAHLNQYVVYQDYVYEALQDLDIIHLGPKIHSGNQYMCINAICKWLYEEKFKKRMKASHKFGLQSVHNFLWHYHYYEIKGKKCWWDKDC